MQADESVQLCISSMACKVHLRVVFALPLAGTANRYVRDKQESRAIWRLSMACLEVRFDARIVAIAHVVVSTCECAHSLRSYMTLTRKQHGQRKHSLFLSSCRVPCISRSLDRSLAWVKDDMSCSLLHDLLYEIGLYCTIRRGRAWHNNATRSTISSLPYDRVSILLNLEP